MGNEVKDNINPDYYKKGEVECIQAIKAATIGKTGIEAVDTGQVIKYLWRYEGKNGREDIKKALWYLENLLVEVEAREKREESRKRPLTPDESFKIPDRTIYPHGFDFPSQKNEDWNVKKDDKEENPSSILEGQFIPSTSFKYNDTFIRKEEGYPNHYKITDVKTNTDNPNFHILSMKNISTGNIISVYRLDFSKSYELWKEQEGN